MLLLACCFFSTQLWATHYRAGEIYYETIGNFQIKATVVTYTKVSPPSNQADRDTVTIDWGDGTNSVIARVNGPINTNGFPNGEMVATDIKMNKYVGTHTYPGAPVNGFFIISFLDQNRMAGINNISGGNSVDVPFYIEDTLKFPNTVANVGFDNSPILLNPPIDYANVNDTFYHNPNAYDPNGDSLWFDLRVPLQDQIDAVPFYLFPDQYCQSNGEPNCTLTIDHHTGEVTWAVPCQQGIFNVAIIVHEYRNGVEMGTLIRDMQIIVLAEPNHPPRLKIPADTCIHAGDTLIGNVTATDPDLGQKVTISANGGPFQVSPSATFDSTVGNPATGHFRWITSCDEIQAQPYLVVFKASDDYTVPGPFGPTPASLVDVKTWQIRVIPPPVLGIAATTTHNSVTITWQNPYKCAGAANFRGFSVWRKVGCDSTDFDYCQSGLDGTGYVKLTTNNIFTYSFTDNTTVVGQEYSYRVVAEFSKVSPNGRFFYDIVESSPSAQVCVFMPVNVPVIINVSVLQTDPTNGQMFVRWTKPFAGSRDLDTLNLNPPPYRFEVYRGSGFTPGGTLTLVHSSVPVTAFYLLTDTFFTDNNLDTKTGPWNYQVKFFSNLDTLVGTTTPASSVFLTLQSTNEALILHSQYTVPWLNDSFAIYRYNKLTSVYDSIATAYTKDYADTNLINDSTYCYYVKAYGHYTVTDLPKPLINLSEEVCGVPVDTVPPCPPVLTVKNDCDQYNGQPWTTNQYTNHLSWSYIRDSCSLDIAKYRIYYNGNDSSSFALLDSLGPKDDTTYNHILNDNLAGCYAVTAVDHAGNESKYSNIVCIDNCPYYVLPNAFTPNGDGHNDVFTPFKPYRFVPKIEMKIFNRWGELIYETNDPEINWKGLDMSGHPVSDGVYLYAGYLYEQHLGNLVKNPLSGKEKGGGFIHLIRGK